MFIKIISLGTCKKKRAKDHRLEIELRDMEWRNFQCQSYRGHKTYFRCTLNVISKKNSFN